MLSPAQDDVMALCESSWIGGLSLHLQSFSA